MIIYYYNLSGLKYDDPIPTKILDSIKEELNNKYESGFFYGNANVIGDEGNYSFSVSLRPDGLSISSEYYDQEDENW